MTTPDQPTDPYRPEPDPSSSSTGGVPQYGQYSAPGSEPAGTGGQPPAYPGYAQQGGYAGAPPQNYLVFSILTTVLCCLPLGVASIVFSAQVNSKWNAGDHAGAAESARKAKQFAIWSAAVGVVGSVLYGILVFAGVVGGGLSDTSY